jgi:DNA methylase
MPWRVAFALQNDGWYLRADIIWAKPNPMPESIRNRPTKAHEYLFLLSPSGRYYYDAEAAREPVTGNSHPRGHGVNPRQPARPAGRRRQVATPESRRADTAPSRTPVSRRQSVALLALETDAPSGRSRPSRTGVPISRPFRSASSTPAFSPAPARRVPARTAARLGNAKSRSTTVGWKPACTCGSSPRPAVVLDPFAGSGTTLAVAARLGRRAIGVELSPVYIDLIRQRCGQLQLGKAG